MQQLRAEGSRPDQNEAVIEMVKEIPGSAGLGQIGGPPVGDIAAHEGQAADPLRGGEAVGRIRRRPVRQHEGLVTQADRGDAQGKDEDDPDEQREDRCRQGAPMVVMAMAISREEQDEAPVEGPCGDRDDERPGQRGQEDPQHPEREQGEGDAEDDGGEALRGWERC